MAEKIDCRVHPIIVDGATLSWVVPLSAPVDAVVTRVAIGFCLVCRDLTRRGLGYFACRSLNHPAMDCAQGYFPTYADALAFLTDRAAAQ